MTHRNSPLSYEARLRLVYRAQTRPISHIAAEMGVSRACASKWVNRYRRYGEAALNDRPSTPHHQPTATPADVIARIERMRRDHKWSATRIVYELAIEGTHIGRSTVTRILKALGLNRRRFIDPNGETNRPQRTINARWPGHMVHIDIKKVGRIPDGGGHRVHGRNSAQARAVTRAKTKTRRKTSGGRTGYVYLHSAVDGHTRMAYTEALSDETAPTAIGFMHRARAFFAAHGIHKIDRIVTDNGACYRAKDFAGAMLGSKHQRITPYTPRHNGKVERYNRILSEEFLYARVWTSEAQRAEALCVWNIHYNYHRPHSATRGNPPASKARKTVTNLMSSYT